VWGDVAKVSQGGAKWWYDENFTTNVLGFRMVEGSKDDCDGMWN